jgi:hypothetical protein
LIHPAYSAPTQQQKTECAEAFNQGQKLLKSGQLRAANKRFVACSQPVCPDVLINDCIAAVEDINRRQPSVIFDAKDSRGVDVIDVKVTEKDAPISTALDGQAVILDPGIHDFHFVYKDQAIDQRVVVREGDKLRHLPVVFDRVPPPPPSASVSRVAPPPSSGSPASSFSLPSPEPPTRELTPGVITFGAIGVAAFAVAAYFDLKGRSDLSNLKSSCAPRCEPSKIDSVKTKLRVGDISLAVGVAALGGAALFYFTGSGVSTSPPSDKISFGVSPTVGGAFGALHLGFQ